MINLALVGFGGYGWDLVRYIRAVSESSDCRLIAAADNRLDEFPERTRELSDSGVDIFDDAIEMFAKLRGRCPCRPQNAPGHTARDRRPAV